MKQISEKRKPSVKSRNVAISLPHTAFTRGYGLLNQITASSIPAIYWKPKARSFSYGRSWNAPKGKIMTLNPRSDCDQTGFVSTLRQNCCRPMDAKRQNHLTDGGKKSLRRKIVRRNKLRLTRRLRANREAFFCCWTGHCRMSVRGYLLTLLSFWHRGGETKKRKIIKTPHEQCSADIRIEPEIDISIELLQSKCA